MEHMIDLLSYPWEIMMPEFTILGIATLLSLMDLFMKGNSDRRLFAWISFAGTLLAIYFVFVNIGQPVQQILFDTYRLDGFANGFKLIFLVGAAFVFLISLDYLDSNDIRHKGEFYYVTLLAVLGAMMLASSADLITMFVGLELLSIASYVLAGMSKRNLLSNESSFKYVVSGATATAITLYGLSFIYGLTGSSNLFEIGERLVYSFAEGYQFMIYFAFFLTFVGLAFKVSAVPYHMWTADVYQGAPTPVTAFLAVVSKAAGFAFLIRFFMLSFLFVGEIDQTTGFPKMIMFDLGLFIAIAAALSMIIGNTMALRQTNVKRLFAFSGIAQAGYILIPFALAATLIFYKPNPNLFLGIIMYYLFAYLFMNLGAFAVIQLVTKAGETNDLRAFAGLYHRSPFIAVAMTIFLLSLAGLPITAGFVGKFYIFIAALEGGSLWLAAVMVLTSVISYVYYFSIAKQMYMRPGTSEAPLRAPLGIWIVILLCLVGTIVLAIFPTFFFEYIETNFNLVEMFELVGLK